MWCITVDSRDDPLRQTRTPRIPCHYCHHHEEKKNDPDVSGLLVQVRPVVEAPADVHVNTDEEEGGPISVHITDHPPVVDVSADVGD